MVELKMDEENQFSLTVWKHLSDGRSSPLVEMVSTLSGESVSVNLILMSLVSKSMSCILKDVQSHTSGILKVLVPVEIQVLKNLVKFIGNGFETFNSKNEVVAVGQAANMLGISTVDWEVQVGNRAKKTMVPIKNEFDCDICLKAFVNKYSLVRHKARVHGATVEKSFSCEPCKKTFYKKYSLDSHQLSKKHKRLLSEYRKSTAVQRCDFDLTDELSLIVPIKKVPKCVPMKKKVKLIPPISGYGKRKFRNGEWVCTFCHLSFKSYFKLNIHLDKLHNVKITKFTCNVCDYTSYYKTTLQRHKKTKNHLQRCAEVTEGKLQITEEEQDLVMYACDQCQMTFSSKKQHSSHMSSRKHKKLKNRDVNHNLLVKLEANKGEDEVTRQRAEGQKTRSGRTENKGRMK